MKQVSVLGSTGSIGTQTLEVIRQNSTDYEVAALSGSSSIELLLEQAKEFSPRAIAITDEQKAKALKAQLPGGIDVLSGKNALAEAAVLGDVAVNGVVGFAGLPVTLAALNAGKRLALANKESLIAAGPLVKEALKTEGAELIPVDSEHCAVHQCLRANDIFSIGNRNDQVKKIVLTASGGPFRGKSKKALRKVKLAEALNHPTWDMGPKVTVDSSTLMNKGLEVIEAHELFGVDYSQIEVVVHPQSIVHSMVEFTDGSTVAQLSNPDMRLCIAYAMAYPNRVKTAFGSLNWTEINKLSFEIPDLEAFPALDLAYEAGRRGNTAPAVLNAANEVANQAFLEKGLPWHLIPEVVSRTLEHHGDMPASSLEAILNEDGLARQTAEKAVREAV